MWSLNFRNPRHFSRSLWLLSVPRGSIRGTEMSGDLDGQGSVTKTWTACGKYVCQSVDSRAVCVLWYSLAETRAHQRRRQHPLLTSAALFIIVLRLRYQYCMPGTPITWCNFVKNKEYVLNSILLLTSSHFRASCIQTDYVKTAIWKSSYCFGAPCKKK